MAFSVVLKRCAPPKSFPLRSAGLAKGHDVFEFGVL